MIENKKFLTLLVSEGIITEKTLQELCSQYQNNAFDILLHLTKQESASKNKLGMLWGDSIGTAYIDLSKAVFQTEIVEKLPEDFARKNQIIPIYQFGKGITIATSNPENSFVLNKVEKSMDCLVSPMFAFPEDIDEAIDLQYSSNKSLEEITKKISVNTIVGSDKNNPKSENNLAISQKEIEQCRSMLANMPNPEMQKLESKSVISETTKKHLVDNTNQVLNDVSENKIPKIETCNKISNTILEEVDRKMDLIFCIRQLRVSDEQAYSHTINVAMMSSVIAKMMGFSTTVIKEITLGAFLHDIGKMRVPKKVLYKTGKLEPYEAELIKKHTVLGHQIAKMMGLHDKVTDVVLSHHERMDGRGYPQGLTGEDISLNTQIVSIVDVYDLLLSNNKNEISHHEAINLMMIEGQKAFNANILYKFVSLSYNHNAGGIKKMFKSVVYGDIV